MKLKDLRNTLTEAKANKSAEQASIQGHMQNVNRLVRRGLLPASDLPILRSALNSFQSKGDMAKLPLQQRTVLQKYNKAIENAALGSTTSIGAVSRNIHSSFDIEGEEFLGEAADMRDPPMMMVLKRKGIRIFPDGKRVALYVNEKLGLTFTIPYSTSAGMENPMVGVTEDVVVENIKHLKDMVTKGEPRELKFLDGTSAEVHHDLAKKILMVHDSLNDENKAKLADMLSASKNKFLKVANFAHEKVKPAVPNA